MSLITRLLKAKAVYWPPVSNDRFGKPTWGDPIELNVRWEKITSMDKSSQAELAEYTDLIHVSQDVEVGGMIMLGELTSGLDPDPKESLTAREIQRFDKLPNLRYTEYLRLAYLKFGI